MGTHKGSTAAKGNSGLQAPKGRPHVAANASHHGNLHGASAGKGISTAHGWGKTFGGLSGTRTSWSGGSYGLGFGSYGLGSYGGYGPSYSTYGVYDGDVAVAGGIGSGMYYQYQGPYPTYQYTYYLPNYQPTPPSYYVPNNELSGAYPVNIASGMPYGSSGGFYRPYGGPNLSQPCCCCPPGLYSPVDMNDIGYVMGGDQ
jgi:hypothetical protein